MPVLTDLDERAEVNGSRDPLGLVPVWSKFGREVVGNLTTVTGSVRGFTTLLVGLELADMLGDQFRRDAPPPIKIFLRFEQLAGYEGFECTKDKEVRGYGDPPAEQKRRLEERRRLFYVAPTRTTETLILSSIAYVPVGQALQRGLGVQGGGALQFIAQLGPSKPAAISGDAL